jgi:hypothetical protein
MSVATTTWREGTRTGLDLLAAALRADPHQHNRPLWDLLHRAHLSARVELARPGGPLSQLSPRADLPPAMTAELQRRRIVHAQEVLTDLTRVLSHSRGTLASMSRGTPAIPRAENGRLVKAVSRRLLVQGYDVDPHGAQLVTDAAVRALTRALVRFTTHVP